MGSLDWFLDQNQEENPIQEDAPASRFTVTPEVDSDVIEDPQAPEVVETDEGESRFDVTREAAEGVVAIEWDIERTQLREELSWTAALEAFSLEEIEFCEWVIEQNSWQISAAIAAVEAEIEAAWEYSEDELIVALGNIILTWDVQEAWSEIQSEVSRIVALEDGEEISLSMWEDGEKLIFETKREALLYLYYQKLSLKWSQECIDSIDTSEMTEEERTNLLPIIKWGIIGLILTSTAGTILRKINHFLLRTTGWRFGSWSYISVSSRWSEWPESVGTWEVQKRWEVSRLLDYVFVWNDSINSGRLPELNVLDHRVNVNGENIGWRLFESSYWREVRHLSRNRWFMSFWRLADFTLKPLLLNSEWWTVGHLQNAANIKNDVLRQLFQVQEIQEWEQITYTRVEVVPGAPEALMLDNMRAFIDLSHEVSNTDEKDIRIKLNEFLVKLRNGEVPFVYNMRSTEAALREVQHQLLEITIWKRWNRWDITRVFWDGTPGNPGEWARLLALEVRPDFTNMDRYNEGITARKVQAQIEWEAYDERAVRVQLQEFFDSIGNGADQNRYNYKTASLIVERILAWKTKDEAITEAFAIDWEIADRTVTDRRYLWLRNAEIVSDLEEELIKRANDIWSIEELRNFERDVINSLKQDDGSPRVWFWEILRTLESIVTQKEGESLPDTRVAPAPSPTTWEAAQEVFKQQEAFDSDWKLTDDARTIYEWNIAQYILDGGEVVESEIQANIDAHKTSNSTIWDIIEDLRQINYRATIEDLATAQEAIDFGYKFQIQDVVERWLMMWGIFSESTDVDITLSSDKSSITIDISWDHPDNFTVANDYATLENELRTKLWFTWDILEWDEILVRWCTKTS